MNTDKGILIGCAVALVVVIAVALVGCDSSDDSTSGNVPTQPANTEPAVSAEPAPDVVSPDEKTGDVTSATDITTDDADDAATSITAHPAGRPDSQQPAAPDTPLNLSHDDGPGDQDNTHRTASDNSGRGTIVEHNPQDLVEQALRKTIAANPADAVAWRGLGAILLEKSKFDEAKQCLNKAIELAPNDPSGYYDLARVWGAEGKLDESAAYFQRVIALKSDHTAAQYSLGVVLGEQGKFAQSIDHFRKALSSYPKTPALVEQFEKQHAVLPALEQVYYSMASACASVGDLDLAAHAYRKAIEHNPQFTLAYVNVGRLYLLMSQLDQAMVCLQKAAELEPNNPQIMALVGDGLIKQRKFAQARPVLEKVLAAEPDHPRALQCLAWLLATCPQADLRNGDKAVELARHASKLTDHEDPATQDTLAAAYAETGQYNQAIATLNDLLKLIGPGYEKATDQLRERLKLYQQHKPYRDATSPTVP